MVVVQKFGRELFIPWPHKKHHNVALVQTYKHKKINPSTETVFHNSRVAKRVDECIRFDRINRLIGFDKKKSRCPLCWKTTKRKCTKGVMLSCAATVFQLFTGLKNKLLWLINRIYIRFLKFVIFCWRFIPITFPWKLDSFDIERGFSILNTVHRPYSVKLSNLDSFFYNEWKPLFYFLPWYILSCPTELSW